MTTEHKYRSGFALALHDGAEHEFGLIIGFTYTPGEPERGPSYASGGEPAFPPEVEITSVRAFDERKREATGVAAFIRLFIEADDAIREILIETAQEDAVAERDHYAELEADERRLRSHVD